MKSERSSFWENMMLVLGLISILYLVQIVQYLGIFDFTPYGVWPHHREGLKGIIFSPFIHANFDHLISNTLPIAVLLTVLLNAYPSVALWVLIFIHLLSGAMVWAFAPGDGVHIGISGIIYGIAAFLVASGWFRRDRVSITIAIMVVLVYGGMVWGFIPQQGISWQSHLYGAISGGLIAFLLRRNNVPVPTGVAAEKPEEEKHFFDSL